MRIKQFSKVFGIAFACFVLVILLSSSAFAEPSLNVVNIESTGRVSLLGQIVQTQPTTISCDEFGNEKNSFVAGETIYVKGSGFLGGSSYILCIRYCGVMEGSPVEPEPDPSGAQEHITANPDGTIPVTSIWEIPVTYYNPIYGENLWSIIIDKEGPGEGIYNAADDGLDQDYSMGYGFWVPVLKRVFSCDKWGNEKNVFTAGETVYIEGQGFYKDTQFKIWIQPDPAVVGDVLDPADDPSGSQEIVWSTMMWEIPRTAIWNIDPSSPPVTLENWNIIIVEDYKSTYLSTDGIDDFSVASPATPNPELPPVVLFGFGLLGIGGYLGFSRLRNRKAQAI